MHAKFWTENELFILKNKKIKGESWEVFHKREIPWRNKKAITDKAFQLGIKSGYNYKKYSFKEDLWESKNPENCYWSGFVGSDGCISKQTHSESYVLCISLKSTEAYHLEKFKEFCEFTGPLRAVQHCKRKNSTTQSIAIVVSKKWREDLANNFNIVPRKTHTLKPPTFENDYLMDSYILGMWDGDGCVHLCDRGKGEMVITLTSASSEMAYWLQDRLNFLIRNSEIKNKAGTRKVSISKGGYFSVRVAGHCSCVLIDYFRQFPLPKMDRKWNDPRIVEFVEKQKLKYPDKFLTLEIPPQFR